MSIDPGILQEIYGRLDVREVIPELQPQDKGQYYLLICPDCGKREAYLYKDGKQIKCNRANNCRYSKSLWDYLQAKNSYSNKEVLEYLARITGYPLPELESEAIEKVRAAHDTSNLLQDMTNFFRDSLKEARELQEYLAKRGYTATDIEAMGLGYYPGKQATRQYLFGLGYTEEQLDGINALAEDEKKLWDREEYKLVFPYLSPSGYIKGIWGRLTRPLHECEKEGRKYLPFLETDRETPFGYRYGMKELIIAEGYLDCLIGQRKNFPVVAAGSNRLSQAQIDFIKKAKPDRIILALDNDRAGQQGTIETIQKLEKLGIKCYVAASLPDGYKDIDELLTRAANGKEIFQVCLDNALSMARWTAKHFVKTIDSTTDIGREQLFEKLLSLANACRNPLDRQAVREEIAGLGMDTEEMAGYLDSIQRQEAEQKRKKAYEALLEEAKAKLADGTGLAGFFAERATAIENEYQQAIAREQHSQAERIQELYSKEKRQEACELLGYRLTTEGNNDFKPIEKDLEGIQAGLYILGAQTNVGKTAFVANLAYHLLNSNDNLTVLYFSLDDNYAVTATRMRAIIAFRERRLSDMAQFLSSNIAINEFRKHLETPRQEQKYQANQTFLGSVKSNRLEIYDIADTPRICDIELVIRQKADKTLAVVIDGLYNAAVPAGNGGIREENIERANRIKALVDTYSIPVICTAEVRKKAQGRSNEITIDDLMESGKFGYNANLVWLLSEMEETAPGMEMVKLSLDYAKNKLTSFKGRQEVQYYRRFAKMFVHWQDKKGKGMEELTDGQGENTAANPGGRAEPMYKRTAVQSRRRNDNSESGNGN